MELWIISATHEEIDYLKVELGAILDITLGPCTIYKTHTSNLCLAVTGIGLCSCSTSLGIICSLFNPSQVIMVGICGSYPQSGINIGDLVVPREQILSEAGVCIGTGVGDASVLGLEGFDQALDFDFKLSSELFDLATKVSKTSSGKMLTVMGVSAHSEHVEARQNKFSPVAEDMEGFALAFAGRAFGLPVAQIRGVSNVAGDRNKANWNMELAAKNVQLVILEYINRKF